MKRQSSEVAATTAIVQHISQNPILFGDGFCLNDRFAEDYAYAESTLRYVYAGTLLHMSGMTDDWPQAAIDPLAMPLSDWIAIAERWGTAGAAVASGALSAPRIMWQTMSDIVKDDGTTIPELQPDANGLRESVQAESAFLKSLWDKNTNLFDGTLALAARSLVERKEKAPLMHWLYYLSAVAGVSRQLVDALVPPAGSYVCLETIYNLISE